MDTRQTIVAAAISIIERDGQAKFTTREVCDLACVTAPTLYHHFGSVDGLLSAVITEAFDQFLLAKEDSVRSPDPIEALREGWDGYVLFAARRPRLYGAMMARVLQGINLPAADNAYRLLVDRIEAIAAVERLKVTVSAASQIAWASANAAALLHVTAALQVASEMQPADVKVIESLRDRSLETILRTTPSRRPRRI